MKKFTKKERHEIYKMALERYRIFTRDFTYTGLYMGICHCLYDAVCYHLHNEYFFDTENGQCALSPEVEHEFDEEMEFFEIVDMFPEFKKHKPTIYSSWWWDTSDMSIRIKVLNECIKETQS